MASVFISGTGKTLMARQIGKMLNARESKIINGPEILNTYVGVSEESGRMLFQDAEEEQKRVSKPNYGAVVSNLHFEYVDPSSQISVSNYFNAVKVTKRDRTCFRGT